MSNAGPLTTTFTAPASCTTATGLYQIWDSNTYHFEQGPLASMTDCFPSGYDASASQYYSPGICPSGYTTACSSTDVLSATVTETAYTCCPRGRVEYTCAASASGSHLGCTTVFGDNIGIAELTAISKGSTYSTQVIATVGEGISANGIAVRLRAGDFATTGQTVLATATSQAAPNPTSTSSSSTKASGLSTVGIAGIGVGAGALVFAIAGTLGFCLWVRRRKQKAFKKSQSPLLPSYPNRGPPPPRPPRPLEPPLRPVTTPPPLPPKDLTSDRPFSPSPSTTSSDVKKAREVEVYKVRNIEIKKKRPRDMDSKKSRSTFDSSNGPFELPGGLAEEKERQMYEMYELYGEWPQSPSSSSHLMSSSKSFETFQSTDSLWSHPSSPKPGQGVSVPPPPSYVSQPAELESQPSEHEAPLARPQKSFATPHRHRRMPSGRWGKGTSWAPAELPTPDENGFL
ncbi:hypothetical protein N0V93_001527 [Gnomoniopsis smithogilvyi]|uniref:Uncharacterized protein n=1 Tax=Gnomoniopsis smithogilvyi TaxID=1191159 RepID=A0A9W8Z3Y0_9PEZI|nr:hypothetical protein N0V93_001527 [Gnomoniopsis smithogilvyi]